MLNFNLFFAEWRHHHPLEIRTTSKIYPNAVTECFLNMATHLACWQEASATGGLGHTSTLVGLFYSEGLFKILKHYKITISISISQCCHLKLFLGLDSFLKLNRASLFIGQLDMGWVSDIYKLNTVSPFSHMFSSVRYQVSPRISPIEGCLSVSLDLHGCSLPVLASARSWHGNFLQWLLCLSLWSLVSTECPRAELLLLSKC